MPSIIPYRRARCRVTLRYPEKQARKGRKCAAQDPCVPVDLDQLRTLGRSSPKALPVRVEHDPDAVGVWELDLPILLRHAREIEEGEQASPLAVFALEGKADAPVARDVAPPEALRTVLPLP